MPTTVAALALYGSSLAAELLEQLREQSAGRVSLASLLDGAA
jgi:hypothetical protein